MRPAVTRHGNSCGRGCRQLRLLGVDYGGSRTGLALSDPFGVTCRPIAVLAEKDSERVIKALVSTVEEYEAEGIVVGLPRPLSGGTNQQLQDVLAFVERLERDSPVPVSTWDERFTTSLAEKGKVGPEPRDAVAACYMLQSYLDKLSAQSRER